MSFPIQSKICVIEQFVLLLTESQIKVLVLRTFSSLYNLNLCEIQRLRSQIGVVRPFLKENWSVFHVCIPAAESGLWIRTIQFWMYWLQSLGTPVWLHLFVSGTANAGSLCCTRNVIEYTERRNQNCSWVQLQWMIIIQSKLFLATKALNILTHSASCIVYNSCLHLLSCAVVKIYTLLLDMRRYFYLYPLLLAIWLHNN